MIGPKSNPRCIAVAYVVLACSVLSQPARADRCDDLANQLKSQIDGLSVGKTAANVIYLSHPAATQVRLGCANRDVTNEFYAEATTRKPTSAFFDMVASAAAIIFTVPRDDTLKGATRCIKRMNFFRGDSVTSRYRRLNMNCTRSKTNATITISRERDT